MRIEPNKKQLTLYKYGGGCFAWPADPLTIGMYAIADGGLSRTFPMVRSLWCVCVLAYYRNVCHVVWTPPKSGHALSVLSPSTNLSWQLQRLGWCPALSLLAVCNLLCIKISLTCGNLFFSKVNKSMVLCKANNKWDEVSNNCLLGLYTYLDLSLQKYNTGVIISYSTNIFTVSTEWRTVYSSCAGGK